MSYTNRIVLLIDMDCFYCQVEENLDPKLKGKPLAVVQYNQWRGGGIIAVNYPARDRGVTRHMRGNDAKEKCPEIILAKVPQVRGKADLSKYRNAGKKVADVLQTFTPFLERASVDEAYLDITNIVEKRIQEKNDNISIELLQNTFVVGNSTKDFLENVTQNKQFDEANFKLALGGVIAEEIRAEVFKITGYRCSAGVAHNKILAKLVCGLHKPNKQTILPQEVVAHLYENLPVKKIGGLGGKFGNSVVDKLNIQYMGELSKFTQKELAKKFDEKSALFLYNISRGIDNEPVNTRLIAKSIGCSKNFPGKTSLCTKEDIEHWLTELAEEIFERLEKDFEENNRKARQMVVSFAQEVNNEEINSTKSHPLNSYEKNKIFDNAFKIIQKHCMKNDGSYKVTFLGISASNFQDVKKVKEITSFFKNMENKVKKERNSSSDSLYSNATDVSDNNEENLIYYEQLHPESIANQNFDCENNSDDLSDDSISDEIICPDVSSGLKSPELPAAESFFSKYFNENSNRNFNTSRALDNNNSDLSEDVSDEKLMDLSNEDTKNGDEITNCSECGKIVKNTEYLSHLDYHFALSIVKNEAHLYKNTNASPPINNSSKTIAKKRKKDVAISNSKPIAEYFKNNTIDKNNCETKMKVCTECNKQILINDWEVHIDYHAAKKLHLELNMQRKLSEKVQIKGKKQQRVANQKSLMTFLKTS